ncbi:Protein transport protein SFT2 [Holothuria leucospilota]|uniref:Vesicle transport protein n=1 Tax=Holothuria leucospilota TaxID=206669 RepID=A0A9Q0YGJ8_HOLLE|nr:Protein transport protein SFT2 [Holothuria leucospilota]
MSDLNADLKSYLSGSKSKKGSGGNGSGIKLTSVTSWFGSEKASQSAPVSEDEEPLMTEQDSTNGWFSQAQKDPWCPTLTKKQRIVGFMMCLLGGLACFLFAWCFLPVLALKPRKFALLYTLGSIFTLGSFALLWGPVNHLKHLFSVQRLPFTAAYFGTIAATLYFVFVKQITLMALICSICQVIALVWYLVSYIPGGQTGLTFFSKLFATVAGKTISNTLPV